MSGSLVTMFKAKKSEGDVALPPDVGRTNAMILHAQRGLGRQLRPFPWELGSRGGAEEVPIKPSVYKGESMAAVLKVNPYHDGDGKFTTKDKSKIFAGKKLPTGKTKELTGDEAQSVIDAAHGKVKPSDLSDDHNEVWNRATLHAPWSKVSNHADTAQEAFSHAMSQASNRGRGLWAIGTAEGPTHDVSVGSKTVRARRST